jgi:hypothetical protein
MDAVPSKTLARLRTETARLMPWLLVPSFNSVVAHELAEVVSDPEPDHKRAWIDKSGYENGDKCSYKYGQTYRAKNGAAANIRIGNRDYLIQQNWRIGVGCSNT